MKKLAITNKMTDIFQSITFGVKKHSPEILITFGIGGVIVGTVMACRATTKLNPILEECNEKMEQIKASDNITKKDITLAYAHTGIKITKLYMPSASIGILSVTSILASNNILRKRNVALAAAYTALDVSFKEYRSRVVGRFGEEVENEIRYNMKSQKIEETIIDENGKEKKVKKTVQVAGENKNSDYVMYYDKDTSNLWEKDHSYNMMFLRSQQAHCTNRLSAKKRLFLNDVYALIGVEPTKAGQIVGWDLSNPASDEFIDFKIQEVYREIEDVYTGEKKFEPAILLDFNVAGDVWTKMSGK